MAVTGIVEFRRRGPRSPRVLSTRSLYGAIWVKKDVTVALILATSAGDIPEAGYV